MDPSGQGKDQQVRGGGCSGTGQNLRSSISRSYVEYRRITVLYSKYSMYFRALREKRETSDDAADMQGGAEEQAYLAWLGGASSAA